MSRTLIGVVSYSGIRFLEMFLRSVQETLTKPADVLVIVAKPDDSEMKHFLSVRGFPFIAHGQNKGFPASINDLYQHAFVDGDYDSLICAGNDVVCMPGALDGMIECADTTDWEMCCASEFNSRFLYDNYPEVRPIFEGPNLVLKDFTARPWEVHKDFRSPEIQPNTLKDVRNLTLFKRSSFEKVGFDDVSFYVNGYFADLDYARRCHLTGVRAAGLPHCAFFHWWSRTIHQSVSRDHGAYYTRNAAYYEAKWGTREWGQERYALPFDGKPYYLGDGITLQPDLKIASREQEDAVIDYWRSLR